MITRLDLQEAYNEGYADGRRSVLVESSNYGDRLEDTYHDFSPNDLAKFAKQLRCRIKDLAIADKYNNSRAYDTIMNNGDLSNVISLPNAFIYNIRKEKAVFKPFNGMSYDEMPLTGPGMPYSTPRR